MVQNIDYNETNKYWNDNLEQKKLGKFSSGFVMSEDSEEIAKYRFMKELNFLNKYGKFGGNYLDLGCGTGNFLYAWHDKFQNLIGIDFSQYLVKIANDQLASFDNVKIVEDTVLNFKKHIGDKKFKFIFLGGCFMYIQDTDVSKLIADLFETLEDDGVLIFREPTTTKEKIYEQGIGIRRTIREYEMLVSMQRNQYSLEIHQNYFTNYTHFIGFYFKLFPFLQNNLKIFKNPVIEFLFLLLPLKLYTNLKKNMVLYHFFVIHKKI